MALTNPTNLVDVQGLERFKQNLDPRFNSIEAAIGKGSAYEFVDLGLPSGTLWAKCNVGATLETGYGNYYMYGKGATQYNYGDSRYTGMEDPLDPTKDTAAVVMGEGWHMPTKAQLEELVANTTKTTETIDGITGDKFTAQNGNYIFLPYGACYDVNGDKLRNIFGDYWASTPGSQQYAYEMYIGGGGPRVETKDRAHGYMVRAVTTADSLPLTDVRGELANRYTKTEVDNLVGAALKPTDTYMYNGVSYTVNEMLTALATLMPKTIVTQ